MPSEGRAQLGGQALGSMSLEANVIAVFWTNSFIEVLDRLAAHGVPVTRTETDLGFKPLDALLP